MKDIVEIINKIIHFKIVQSLIVIIVNFIVYKIISIILNDKHHKIKLLSSSRGKTYFKMIKSIIRYILIIKTHNFSIHIKY